ncbi:hypothetical protein [Zhihengliuella salsuginis]|uniref:hypothetical protein n=1 Tax=Zhihengliuella salsuginis TaxID=578222 RepID=UPI00167B5BFF|nr:hypothetical protein [Zhihengliuella salsuginis]
MMTWRLTTRTRRILETGQRCEEEVMEMKRQVVNKKPVSAKAIKTIVSRSTKASAHLEHRSVPEGFVRSEQAERFLAERRRRS